MTGVCQILHRRVNLLLDRHMLFNLSHFHSEYFQSVLNLYLTTWIPIKFLLSISMVKNLYHTKVFRIFISQLNFFTVFPKVSQSFPHNLNPIQISLEYFPQMSKSFNHTIWTAPLQYLQGKKFLSVKGNLLTMLIGSISYITFDWCLSNTT